MKNIEVIQHLIGDSATVEEGRLRVACQLMGLDPDAEYNKDDKEKKCLVYKVAISEIMRSKPVKRESEGGYTKEYATTGQALDLLANDSGCQGLIDLVSNDGLIKNISFLW